jgi:AraC-like DNA-binding protein
MTGDRDPGAVLDRAWVMEIIRVCRIAAYSRRWTVDGETPRPPATALERVFLAGLLSQLRDHVVPHGSGGTVQGEPSRGPGEDQPSTVENSGSVTRALKVAAIHAAKSEINVDFIARHVGISRAVLARCVRAETGRTIMDFVHAARLSQAKWLLTHSVLSIKEIACRVGYERTSSLDRCFRKRFGYSPKQFRISADLKRGTI